MYIFQNNPPPRGGGMEKMAMGKKMKKKEKEGRGKKGKKRKRRKREKEEKRKKGGKICHKKFLFMLNKGEKIWNLPFFFPIKPWKWPREKKMKDTKGEEELE